MPAASSPQAPLGDATQGSPGNAGMYTGAAALAATNALPAVAGHPLRPRRRHRRQGPPRLQRPHPRHRPGPAIRLRLLHPRLLHHQHRAERPLPQSQDHPSTTDADANLDYRQGYYADKEFGQFTTADKERQLEDALMLGDPITELTIAMEIDYFQLNRAEYFVPIIVKIPGRELALAKSGGAEHTLIDFVGEIKDLIGGTTVTNVRDNVNIKLTDATAAELANRPIEYDTGFTLLPGKYTIKFLARDDETGRIGTYQTNFVIPNLNKEKSASPSAPSSLSSQRVDLTTPSTTPPKARTEAKEAAANPLVAGWQEADPQRHPRLQLPATRCMSILQAYKQLPDGTPRSSQPLFAFVTFYHDEAKILETQPAAVVPNPAPVSAPCLSASPSTPHLRPGKYDCQVTILDPDTLEGNFLAIPHRACSVTAGLSVIALAWEIDAAKWASSFPPLVRLERTCLRATHDYPLMVTPLMSLTSATNPADADPLRCLVVISSSSLSQCHRRCYLQSAYVVAAIVGRRPGNRSRQCKAHQVHCE